MNSVARGLTLLRFLLYFSPDREKEALWQMEDSRWPAYGRGQFRESVTDRGFAAPQL